MSKIVQIVSSVAEDSSGPSYSVVRLCESLIKVGDSSTIAALDRPPITNPPNYVKTFPILAGPRILGWSQPMNGWLREQMRQQQIDVLHNHGLWMLTNVYPNFIARKNCVPLIVSPRGTMSPWAMSSGSSMKRLYWPLLQKRALQCAFCFHATSESEYDDIRKLGFRQPIALIPNGVDLPNVDSAVTSRSRTVLFLGRVHPKKGIDILLYAWQRVASKFPQWNLRIVGPDNAGYLRKMQDLAGRLQLERTVFSGALEGKDKWKAYCESQLFVLPTHSENFGIAVAEALAAGVPCIVSKGAPWRGIQEQRAGWWIDNNVDTLSDCLSTAMTLDEVTLAQMGQRGRDWVHREFDWSGIGEQFHQTYRWMIEKRDRPSFVQD